MIETLEIQEILEVLKLHKLKGYLVDNRAHQTFPGQELFYQKIRIGESPRITVAVLEISHPSLVEGAPTYTLSYYADQDSDLIKRLAEEISKIRSIKVEIKKVTIESMFLLS